jgi:hypothetical protein
VLVTLLVLAGAALVAGYFAFRPSSEPTTAIVDRTLRVTVRGGEPVGGVQHLTVAKGEQVSLRVDSDVIDEVHVHEYELSGDVRPGGTTEIEFAATMAGRFVIELEERGILIAELEVRP